MITDAEIIQRYNAQREKTTDKQINYIQSLYNATGTHKSEFTERVHNANVLEEQQVFVLIEDLKRKVPISPIQLIQILNQFDEEDILSILKKSIDELTLKDGEILLSGPDKFKPWIKEHPIISEEHWEYGWQESDQFLDDKMYYLKFYDMLMLDIDSREQSEETLEKLIDCLKSYTNLRFRVYQSYGGFHIFITSSLIKYNDEIVFGLTKALGGDIYYALFANKTGFKVRLSPKLGRTESFISKYICDVGASKVDPVCEELIKIHDFYIQKGK